MRYVYDGKGRLVERESVGSVVETDFPPGEAPDPAPEMLRAAYWLAARDGLGGDGMDPRTGRPARFRDLAADLLAHARPALADNGDLEAATGGLRRLLAGGTGAERQRAAYRRRGLLTDVVDAAALTTAGKA